MSTAYSNNSELLKLAAAGDKDALSELIESNMGLVKSIARRFRDRGAEYEDLIQIGTMGMIKAAKSYDFSYNTNFSTYAVPLIIGEIKRFLRDDGLIKVSRNTKRQGCIILKKREEFISENLREPKICELARELDISENEVVYCLEAVSPVHSLNESLGDDDNTTLDKLIPSCDNDIENTTDKLALGEALGKLSLLQQRIIKLRYYRDLSQQQTAKLLDITQVKVSREEKKIYELLRSELSEAK